MKFINNSLCTHSSGNGPLNNHGLIVWMNFFSLGLTWVEVHNGLGISSIVMHLGFNKKHSCHLYENLRKGGYS